MEEPIPVVDHQEGDLEKVTIIDATCEDPGYYYTVHLCSVCNGVIDVSLDSEAPLGHQWTDWFEVAAPTCATVGAEIRLCEHDNSHFEVLDIPLDPTAHVEGEPQIENEKKADCEHDGSYDEVVYCENCGIELAREHVIAPAPGHDWTEPTYTWASDDSSVTAERHCTACDKVETETAKASSQVTKKPTTTEPGEATVTATFENPAFTTQAKTVAIAPTGDDPEPDPEPGPEPEPEPGPEPDPEPEPEPGPEPEPKPDPETAVYIFVSGSDTTWQKGSRETCDFTLKRTTGDETTFGHFVGILIGGTKVDAQNYTASPGSVIVQLQPTYLETLSVGQHSITAQFDDGSDVSTRFNITAESSNANNSSSSSGKGVPKTGDNVPAVFLATLALAAGALLLLAAKKHRAQ